MLTSCCLVFDGSHHHLTPYPRNATPVVGVALDLSRSDLRQAVTGSRTDCRIQLRWKATIRIVELNKASAAVRNALKTGVPIDELDQANLTDSTSTSTTNSPNSRRNGRGTAYGTLELRAWRTSPPWVWWGDDPERRTKLAVSRFPHTAKCPLGRSRGIFLNDETGRCNRGAGKRSNRPNPGASDRKPIAKIFELLLRLARQRHLARMHGFTTPFYFRSGAKARLRDSCDVIGTSHCEPLMRNNVGEWDTPAASSYNYINRDSVQAYRRTTERVRAMPKIFYTIGMWASTDGAMEGSRHWTKRPRPCNGSSATSADSSKSTSAAPPQRFRRSSRPQGSARNHGERARTCPTT